MKKVKKEHKKHPAIRNTFLCLLALIIIAALIFMHFGGFSMGKIADVQEFAKYADTVEDITVPENVTIIALGEATHGNSEFQQLKLSVFKLMVENYGVRAFALEGDCGGCETVNRYIHGGNGTAEEAAAAIGFAIYRTDEMAQLISYMRQYNDSAAEGDDLRFYGFDMQRCLRSFNYLVEACGEMKVNTEKLELLISDDDWSDKYDYPARIKIITQIKNELEGKENSAEAAHFADVLLQYCELQTVDSTAYGDVRDKLMAENTLWIAQQERSAGYERIFISGHNGHIGKFGYDNMGKLLTDELCENYYAIGTDFCKTKCNMPRGSSGKRTNQVFYSHSPLANTAKLAGLDMCWLDFSKIPEDSALKQACTQYNYMGSLGEGYSLLMRILPPSYRIFQPAATLYDSMIFVVDAIPTTIISEK